MGFSDFLHFSVFFSASAYGKDEAHSKLSAFVTTGQDLYKRAATIVGKSPKTKADVDRIFFTMGKQWQLDEHAFQESFWPMLGMTGLPDDVREGIVRIGQFDNFVFNAVGDSYICHITDAHWDLKIAGEILAHAAMASDGHPDPDWNPDLDSEPEDHAQCHERQ
jgi:hypothetical protein